MTILYWLVKQLFKLPPAIKLLLAGGKRIEHHGEQLDLDIQIIARSASLLPQLESLTPQQARTRFKLLTSVLRSRVRKGQEIENKSIKLKDNHPLGIRIFTPAVIKNKACILYFHGGGNVIGDLDSYSGFCSDFAAACHTKVIAVDYRMAPEFKFPYAINDAFEAYQWLIKHSQSLNINPNNIIVAGESAGAYLSSIVSIKARDNKIPAPKAQVLIYLVVHLTVGICYTLPPVEHHCCH